MSGEGYHYKRNRGDRQVPVVLVSSLSHYSTQELPDHVRAVYVEAGPDAADFKVVQLAAAGDIVVTQDYGLASLLLPKGCTVLHHKGSLSIILRTSQLNMYQRLKLALTDDAPTVPGFLQEEWAVQPDWTAISSTRRTVRSL